MRTPRSDRKLPGVALRGDAPLKTHIETVHLKLRDHACPYCKGVAFGQKRSLAFGTASTLKKHISAIHLKTKRSINNGAQSCAQ